MDGDCYTEAQCEAMVMCGNNPRIITPNLTRSIQIDLWPGGLKSYLWQPVIASPVIQQTKMKEPQTAVYGWLYVSVYVEMVVTIRYAWLCSRTVPVLVNGSFCFFCRVS